MKVSVFGNGESRLKVSVEDFRKTHILVGCNAIHRETIIDHLICCDRKMIEEAVENPQTKNTIIYVREEQYQYFRKVRKNKNIKLLPDLPYQGEKRADKPNHWGSGAYAVLISCLLDPEEINLIGFDLYGKEGLVNNVYKGTKNYRGISSGAVDPSYWIYHLSKLIINFPNINFKIYNLENWQLPPQWNYRNVEKVNITCSSNKYLV